MKMETKEVLLGHRAKDVVSGLIGIVVHIAEPMTGMRQFAIQPEGDGSTIPDAYGVDENMLDFVDDGVAGRSILPTEFKYDFGQEVRDITCGQVGTITNKVKYLNGCVRYGVIPKATDNKSPETFYTDEARLEIVSEGIKDKIEKKDGKKPGGPNTSVRSMNVR